MAIVRTAVFIHGTMLKGDTLNLPLSKVYSGKTITKHEVLMGYTGALKVSSASDNGAVFNHYYYYF